MLSTPRTVRLATLAAVARTGGACASGSSNDPFSGRHARHVEIEAVNLDWNDATLYVHRNGHRQRLGTVTGKSDRTFTVDWPSTYEMRIEIDVFTRGSCMTHTMHVDPGDSLRLEIPPGPVSRGDCGERPV